MNGMQIFWLIGGIAVLLVLLVLLLSFVCFRMAFLASRGKKKGDGEELKLPNGAIYEEYRELLIGWMKDVRAMPHEDVQITSFDGLTLHGTYYEYAPDAPIELLFHGYRGSAESDLCGGVKRCFSMGRSALTVDNRAAGKSEGRVITFGINESRDCHSWLEFMGRRFGPDAKIILTGISMGAATVLMAAGRPLPPTVVGVIADCGYTSPKEIIKKVIRDMKLPATLAYPFVRLGAKLYGHFDLEADAPIEAMSRCRVPVIFIHGEADRFVPFEMSQRNYDACTAPKRLVAVKDAGHGLAYPVDCEGYLRALKDFYDETLAQGSRDR